MRGKLSNFRRDKKLAGDLEFGVDLGFDGERDIRERLRGGERNIRERWRSEN